MNQQPAVQQRQYTKGQLAVARARNTTDYVVLGATIGLFALVASIYFIVWGFRDATAGTNFFGQSVGLTFVEGVVIFFGAIFAMLVSLAVMLGLGMFFTRMARQQMLGNSLQVEYSAYAWLRDWANQVSEDLELPRVEIFITQNPVINAYSFGFARPYTLVLNSGSIRYLTKDELKAVVVHEMAHIKYHHTDANVYLMPFLSIPIISVVGSWIAGFWQRRAELTADRLALMYLGDSELVKKSLIKVHVGPDVAEDMNDIARQWLQYNAERPMNHLAQTFSDHPYLVRRLSQIDYWKSVVESPKQATPVATTPAANEKKNTETSKTDNEVKKAADKKSTKVTPPKDSKDSKDDK